MLEELTDNTSLTDMLRMAKVCEGTVHSEEISKQYLELVKTVKQVDAIHQQNNSKSKHTKAEAMEAIGVIAGPNLESLAGVPTVGPAIHPKVQGILQRVLSLP